MSGKRIYEKQEFQVKGNAFRCCIYSDRYGAIIDIKVYLVYTRDIREVYVMVTQVKAWGNSQGIRLSKELLALAGIENNDFLDIQVVDGTILLKKKYRHRTLEERAEEFNGKIGPYNEFDWGEPYF